MPKSSTTKRYRTAAACAAIPLLGTLGLPAAAQSVPDRHAYFGETHVHTSWSFDAYIFGNHVTGPADAYKQGGGSKDLLAKGDTFLAARSNEFGYANYEIVPAPEFLGLEVTGAKVPTSPPAQQ